MAVVEVTGISEMGMGIARLEGKVIFIEDALPGETVDVEVTKDQKKYMLGRATKHITKSPQRAEPICPHFSQCGGCALQHLTYEETLKAKRDWIEGSFRKIGNLSPNIPPVLPSPKVYNYRNKVVFHGLKREDQPFKLGFYRKNSKSIIPISSCYLIPPIFLEIKEDMEVLCDGYKVYPDEVMLRTDGDRILVHLTINRKQFEARTIKNLRDTLKSAFDSIAGFSFTGSKGKKIYLTMHISNTSYLVDESSFFQVNETGAEVLYNSIKNLIQGKDINRLYDLYCGVGSIGIYLKDDVKEVIGIDEVADGIELAKVNGEQNNLRNGTFITGKVEHSLSHLGKKADCVILDPPRGGVHKDVVDYLIDKKPQYVVYVGCGLGKMVRDVKLLVDGGYVVDDVVGVDMFPWTGHVETVVLLSKL